MDNTYKIGNFSFNSKEEYEKALRELNIIKQLSGNVNLKDPVVARKVLISIKKNSIEFSTTIGKTFLKMLKETMQEEVEVDVEKQGEIAKKKISQLNKETIQAPSVATETVLKDEQMAVFAIIEEVSPLRNFISKMLFAIIIVLMYIGESMVNMGGLLACSVAIVWAIILGSLNLRKIGKRKKTAEKYFYDLLSEKEKKKLEEEKETQGCLGVFLGIILGILLVFVPPVGLVVLVILVFIIQFPKLKWLLKNWKAGLLALGIFFYQFVAIGLGMVCRLIKENYANIWCWITLVCMLLSLWIVIRMVEKILNTQFYLGIRNIVSFPIMLFLFVLPFALIGISVYAELQSNSSDGTLYACGTGGGNMNGGSGPNFIYSGEPPQYWVNAPHTQNGGYYRTKPDASVFNNLNAPK